MPTWEQLAARPSTEKIYLVEIELARGVGGATTKTLKLASGRINPALTTEYYAPRIKGVPMFKRSMQEVFHGRTMTAFGSLVLVNADGGLDDDLADWGWEGRPVTLKMGFGPLDVSDYKTIFTGRTGKRSWDDGRLMLPILDKQMDCMRRKKSAYTGSDTLTNLVSACLTDAGITDKDATLWSAWATENPFTCYLDTDGSQAVSTILDRLLSSIGCWWGFDRSGKFILGTFKAPTASEGDADLTFQGDMEILSYGEAVLDKRYWSMTLQYYTTPPTTATTNRQDTNIRSLDPSSLEGGTVATAIVGSTDVTTVRDRLWGLFSVERRIITVAVKVQPLTVRLHSQVRLKRDRFGIDANFRVVGFSEDYAKSRVTMELFR